MLFLTSIVLFGLVDAAVIGNHVLHEKRGHDDLGQWQKADRVSADGIIPLKFGLKQANIDNIYDRLMEM